MAGSRTVEQRLARTVGVALAAMVVILGAPGTASPVVRPAGGGAGGLATGDPVVIQATRADVSAPLRDLVSGTAAHGGPRARPEEAERQALASGPGEADPVVQRAFGTGTIPAPSVSFEGVPIDPDDPFLFISGLPPDTNGEIGPNHYVQMVNTRFAVFDRSGRTLLGPAPINSLFKGFGGKCEAMNDGDPVVLYDQFADRWILSQMAWSVTSFSYGPPFFECIAVSRTADPTGAYNRYAFEIPGAKINDYPKLAVWPDGYYLTFNQFPAPDYSWGGQGVAALERDRMVAGDPGARMVYFDLYGVNPNFGSMLPADVDGRRLPPPGSPNYLIEVDFPWFGFPTNQLTTYRFHVDWARPSASTLSAGPVVPTAPFDPLLCNLARCIPQKTSLSLLDPLSDRLMFRLAYRNFGDHEALVLNHTVDVGGDHAGIRWYEIRDPGGSMRIEQQGTYAPDSEHRWMGSIAMDGNGDIALGYSVSGVALNPAIRYTGRLAGDPPGLMTLGEASVIEGQGANTEARGRWGDYTDMTVDPRDDCTFWYTNEYFPTNSDGRFQTRIASFTFPSCDATPPTGKARAAKGVAGKPVKLRYTTSDNRGETGEEITIYRPNGRRLRAYASVLGPAGAGSLTAKAPRPAGTYRWCLVAFDGKGNRSRPSCAKLTVG